jgi:hypothetical protein
MDSKRVLLIGGGIVAIGGAVIWLHKHAQTAQTNADNAAATDLQEGSLLLQQPLNYSTGADSSGVAVSGPSVDTGNESLQALIGSILNPTTQPTQQPTSTQPSQTSPTSNPVTGPTLPPNTVTPKPVTIGTYTPGSSAYDVHITPGIVNMPLATRMIQ